jgi:adhesin transport system outer membrane protein
VLKRWFIGVPAAVAFAIAASTAAAQTFSFEQLARQALATHPSILSRQSSSAAAKADLDAAEWERYPTPSIELNNDQENTRTALFRLQQPLWSGGRITAGIDAAQSRLQASQSAANETRQDVVQRVIAAFVEALREQERRKALAEGVEQHERLLGLMTRRVEQQVSPRIDQDLAQSRLLQASNDLSTVSQALANALTQLSQLAGTPVAAVSPLDVYALPGPRNRDEALAQTLKLSPTLRRLAQEEEAALAEIEAKKAAYKPQLALRFEHGYASAPVNGIPAYTTDRLMLVVQAQTGAGLSALSGVEAAVARREAVRLQRDAAVRDVQERLALDWEEAEAARARLDNARLAATSAREVYESYTRQFSAGRKTWLDVLNAVRESTQSEVAALDAGAQAAGASLRLRLVTGNLTGILQ